VWTEILNTDAESYDGSATFGNLGEVVATEVPWRDFPCSATVTVPPLGAVWFRFEPGADPAYTGLTAEQIEPAQIAVAKAEASSA
jgi:1,4-alpha-glucan branching enzyme